MRARDAEKFGLAKDASADDVFAAMAARPRLIQHPIGINGRKAALGRPNDRLLLMSIPRFAKSRTFRVARAAPFERAIAAIWQSNWLIGRPPARRSEARTA